MGPQGILENSIGLGVPVTLSFFLVIALWTICWKGLALWHAARRNDTWWFVALLVINTVGILEIVYLFLYAKLKRDELFGSKVEQKEEPAKQDTTSGS